MLLPWMPAQKLLTIITGPPVRAIKATDQTVTGVFAEIVCKCKWNFDLIRLKIYLSTEHFILIKLILQNCQKNQLSCLYFKIENTPKISKKFGSSSGYFECVLSRVYIGKGYTIMQATATVIEIYFRSKMSVATVNTYLP
jgi:hypothetical protein